MNPQYAPQQYGPQGNFPNRPSPTITPQGFQSVPLGPPKQIPNGPPSSVTQNSGPVPNQFAPPSQNRPPGMPPANQLPPGQLPPRQINPGQLPPGQLPPGQLPSGQLPPSGPPQKPTIQDIPQNQFGQPPSNAQNGAPPFPPNQFNPRQTPPNTVNANQFPTKSLNPISPNANTDFQPMGGPPPSMGGQQLPMGGQQPPTGGPPAPLGVQRPPNANPELQQPPNQFPPTNQFAPSGGPPPLIGGQKPPIANPELQQTPNQFPPTNQFAPSGGPSGGPIGGQRPPHGNPELQQTPNQFPPTNQFAPSGGPSGGPIGGQRPPHGNPELQQTPNQFPPTNQFAPSGGPSGGPIGGQRPPHANPELQQTPNQFPPTNQFAPSGGPPPPIGGQRPPFQPQMRPQPNQSYGNLPNQMQNMNLGGSYDNGPHMPPPVSQGSYVNGAQMKPPGAMPGYPPMPGQGRPPLPGHPGSMGQQPVSQFGMQPPMAQPGMQPPMPGQPPMHGQPPMTGGMPGMQPPMPSGPYGQPSPYGQQQQPRRLDPDQMPSPIQVMQDDQRTRSGVFCTNQKGLVPPLITTNFEVQDQGNSSPRYIRSTMYNVPVTQDLMKQTSVPFGLIISPMARTVGGEYPPPIVNFGDLGPVRCARCKAYMCPFMQFIDAGRRFQCLFCKATTDVPTEYFQHLDHTGQRTDRFERPELILGTYEFTATQDYCRNNKLPKPPAIVFVIDVSYNNIKSGLVHLLCAQMKEIIKNLPVDQGQEKSNMKVGFITYNSTVHFYNIKGTLAAPQMMVVGDVQDMFMPLLDGFLSTPEESEEVIDALMQQIPAMFGDTRETETILLPAIVAGLEALKASECAGKLLVFHSTLPIAEAPGKLKNRDDRKLLGTDKERTVLTPQTQAYNQLGQDCVGVGCAVDLFLFNNAYIDIATIGQVSRLTGGEIFKYTYFQADIDGPRLIEDIITDINRPVAFDSIMRVRTSTGVRATDFYGHLFMSNTTDMEIAAIDCDKAVAVEIKHDDKLTEEEGVYIQVALLYTSCSGQRRLRVMNLSLKTCSQMADLYRCCELDAIVNFFGKQSMFKLLENNPKAVKDNIVARAAQMLANYRKNCASPSNAGQLILPECMKLLPLYVNCLLKNDAMSGGSDITLDDRSFVMHTVMVMDIPTSVNFFYPRLIPLADVKPSVDGKVEVPAAIRTTIEKINDQGLYILENGIHMFFYIGLAANPEFLQQVFGVPTAIQVDVDKCDLPALDNPLSITVRSIIDQIRVQRHRCMRLTLIRQREKLEPVFKHFLVEDRGSDGSASYVDFLCHMHKEIRTILS